MMKFKPIDVAIDEIGIKIVIKQRRKKKKLFGIFPRHKLKIVVVWKPFKKGIINNLFNYKLGDWVILKENFKDYHKEAYKITPLTIVENDNLLAEINQILIKNKGIAKWNSKM